MSVWEVETEETSVQQLASPGYIWTQNPWHGHQMGPIWALYESHMGPTWVPCGHRGRVPVRQSHFCLSEKHTPLPGNLQKYEIRFAYKSKCANLITGRLYLKESGCYKISAPEWDEGRERRSWIIALSIRSWHSPGSKKWVLVCFRSWFSHTDSTICFEYLTSTFVYLYIGRCDWRTMWSQQQPHFIRLDIAP